jgi:hypothetical protein
MEKVQLKASIEALIYNWLKFDTETIDIALGMREETNFYVNERTNGFRVVMEYPIGYNDVQGGDIGEVVGVMEYELESVLINFDAKIQEVCEKVYSLFEILSDKDDMSEESLNNLYF